MNKKDDQPQDILTRQQVADMLQISQREVVRLRHPGLQARGEDCTLQAQRGIGMARNEKGGLVWPKNDE